MKPILQLQSCKNDEKFKLFNVPNIKVQTCKSIYGDDY